MVVGLWPIYRCGFASFWFMSVVNKMGANKHWGVHVGRHSKIVRKYFGCVGLKIEFEIKDGVEINMCVGYWLCPYDV